MVYNEIWKKYLSTYKEKNLEAIKEYDRKRASEKYNSDPEYASKRKAQIKLNAIKKRQEKIDSGIAIKPRGRPKTQCLPTVDIEPKHSAVADFYLYIDYEKNTIEELSDLQLIWREDEKTQEERKNKQIKDAIELRNNTRKSYMLEVKDKFMSSKRCYMKKWYDTLIKMAEVVYSTIEEEQGTNKIFDMFLYKLNENDDYNDDYKLMISTAHIFGYYDS